jgi:hypothetical protein
MDKHKEGIFMKMYFGLFVFLFVCILGFQSCATAESSVKGQMTTINTLGGDSFEAIILLKNIREGAQIAKTDAGDFILYANIMTGESNRPGSVIIYADGNRYNVVDPTDWDIDDVYVDRYSVRNYWSSHKKLDDSVIEAMLNANVVTIRAVNALGYMAKGDGVDITKILPALKEFFSK